MILSIGAILGFFSVAFGAYAEHGLKSGMSAESFSQIMTALKYNQIHAVVIIAIGLFLASNKESRLHNPLYISGLLFIAGIMLFSFSIYGANVFNIDILVKLAPLGGLTVMTAWLTLAYSGILSMKSK